MFRFTTAAIACALALSATASFAASQSSASISGLSFTLIDLNPRDGVAPSFSFLSSAGSTLLSVSAIDNAVGESDAASRTRPGTFSFSKQYLTDLANASATGSVSPDGLSVSGQAQGPQTSYSANASTGITGYSQSLNLSVSANTLLLINADVSLSASASNPLACGYTYYCYSTETASATAALSLAYSYYATGVSTSYNANQSLSLQAIAQGAYTSYDYRYNPVTGYYDYFYLDVAATEQNKRLDDVLTAVFTNSSSLTQLGTISLSVNVSGAANTAPLAGLSPVPEADTTALGLAGLGVLGLLLRRRRQS